MSWFARIEEACAAFIERAFANLFPSDLEPAQIARKLVAVMEARTVQRENRLTAPSVYTVYVHPADFERLAPHRAYLEREWAALLRDVATRVGIRFAAASGPAVELRADPSAVAGAIAIDAPESAYGQPYLLRVLDGAPPGTAFRIADRARVGRSRENEISLADPSVSRFHAVFEIESGGLAVRDNASTNGTFVNGQRVATRRLQAGDEVSFGKTRMRVEAER